MVELKQILYKNINVAIEDLGEDGLIILNLDDGCTHILNQSATYLWNSINDVNSADDIIASYISLIDDFNCYTQEDVSTYCITLFQDLYDKQLIYIIKGGE